MGHPGFQEGWSQPNLNKGKYSDEAGQDKEVWALVLINHVPVSLLGDIVIFLVSQCECFSASLLCFSAAPSIIIQLLPTKLVLFPTHITVFGLFYCEYQLPMLRNFQFIQFTIKTIIMLPFIQMFHILLIVQECAFITFIFRRYSTFISNFTFYM